MSTVYVLEPATSAHVVFRTSLGDFEVALWANEVPRAARHFLTQAMTGKYDKTVFNRVLPGLLVQAGKLAEPSDPIRPPEQHSRLRFRYRGILAVADSGEGVGDADQFFLTLAAAPHLDGIHTILGKVIGDSIYNVARVGELELEGERPVDPAVIHRIDVVDQPFDDLKDLSRPAAAKEDCETVAQIAAVARNRNLLSFQRDDVEDGSQSEEEWRPSGQKIATSHDNASDPRLSKETFSQSECAKKSSPKDSLDDRAAPIPSLQIPQEKIADRTTLNEKQTLMAEVSAQTRVLRKEYTLEESNPPTQQFGRSWTTKGKRAMRSKTNEQDTMKRLKEFSEKLQPGGRQEVNDGDWKMGCLDFPKVLGAGLHSKDEYSVIDGRLRSEGRSRKVSRPGK